MDESPVSTSNRKGVDEIGTKAYGLCVKTLLVMFCALLCTTASASGQGITIDAGEAKSLVRAVLRHEHIKLSSPYCELEQIDKPDEPFVRDYLSFSASCDFPNTAATTPFGIYVVSPRTGDVFEFNRCQWFRFPELSRLQRNVMLRTKRTADDEKKYRVATGCNPAR